MCIDTSGRAISDTLAALVAHGVFDRHPNIRVVSAENGSMWMEHLVHMLNRAYGQLPKAFKRHPVEALREHVYVAPYYEDDLLRLRALPGIDRILFTSDYPHPQGLEQPPEFLDEITCFSPADQKKKQNSN